MRRLLILIPFLLLLAACGRVAVTTEVKADGSFQRKVVFHVRDSSMGPGTGAKPDEIFQIPKAAAGLSVVRAKSAEGDLVITVARDVAAGAPVVKDVVVMNKTKAQLSNQVRVTPLGDGRFEYVERLRWEGEKEPVEMPGSKEIPAEIKKALPNLDEAATKRVAERMIRAVWGMFFGPGDPMIGQLLMHPDLAQRRFQTRMIAAMDQALAVEGVSEADRKASLAKLTKLTDSKTMLDPDRKAQEKAQKGDEGNTALIPMVFTAKVPGQILETNGEIDPYTGEVFWAMYGEAAVLEDVVLRVVYKP